MDKKDYACITLAVALLASLGYNAMPDANYYCDSKQIKAYCFDISSTLKTCYTLPAKQGAKICTEGWKKFAAEPQPQNFEKWTVDANGKTWNCEGSKNNLYSVCTSNGHTGYWGELK